jgi:hypothetical protein
MGCGQNPLNTQLVLESLLSLFPIILPDTWHFWILYQDALQMQTFSGLMRKIKKPCPGLGSPKKVAPHRWASRWLWPGFSPIP